MASYEYDPEPETWGSEQARLEWYRRQEKLKLLNEGMKPGEPLYRLAHARAAERYDAAKADEAAAEAAKVEAASPTGPPAEA